jgi:hypothetical protein
MRYLIWVFFLLIACSSTELVETWKSPDIDVFESSKVLIVGMTQNIDARRKFEKQLKKEYESRGIEAFMSLDVFESDFTLDRRSAEEIDRVQDVLLANDFDAILVTKIVGEEDNLNFLKTYSNIENTRRRFEEDYYMNQEIYFDQDYYEKYTVYRAESALYCICPTEDRELIWKGYVDITDPKSINKTVNDYVRLLVTVLEEQQLIKDK